VITDWNEHAVRATKGFNGTTAAANLATQDRRRGTGDGVRGAARAVVQSGRQPQIYGYFGDSTETPAVP